MGKTVFFLGLMASGRDGYNGLVGTIWDLIKNPEKLRLLSEWNIAGLSLFTVGPSIAIVARLTLKRFYSSTLVTREDHQLKWPNNGTQRTALRAAADAERWGERRTRFYD